MPERTTTLKFDYDEVVGLMLRLYPDFEAGDVDEVGITLVREEGSVDHPPSRPPAIPSYKIPTSGPDDNL